MGPPFVSAAVRCEDVGQVGAGKFWDRTSAASGDRDKAVLNSEERGDNCNGKSVMVESTIERALANLGTDAWANCQGRITRCLEA